MPVEVVLVLTKVITVYIWIIILRSLWSWTVQFPHNPLVRKFYHPPLSYPIKFMYAVVDPVVKPFRKLIRIGGRGYMDLGPIIVILLLVVLRAILARIAF